jgi:transposase
LLVSSLLHEGLPGETLVVAIDPAKAESRVWLASGEQGLIRDRSRCPTLRAGVDELERLIAGGDPLIAIEATGSLHRAWTLELERRFPGRVRLFAPSETQAARAQLGSRRFKSDDRDCAALVWLARQGLGRPPAEAAHQALLGAIRHRRQLVAELKVLRQRLHDQLNALWSRALGAAWPWPRARPAPPVRPGRARLRRRLRRTCSQRALAARARSGRLTRGNAEYWAGRWRACLGPPADADLRARRLAVDLERLDALLAAVAVVDAQLAALLAETDGQVLTSLPGVAVVRASAFAAHSLPIERFPSAEQLYAATGLAPASYESASISRRGGISRQGLAEHRDALMAIAWGLSQASPAFRERAREHASRGFAPLQVRVALARHACRLCHSLLRTQKPYDEARYRQARRCGR